MKRVVKVAVLLGALGAAFLVGQSTSNLDKWWTPENCREEVADLCADADVFVPPNPREPFGTGPLEAMASELPPEPAAVAKAVRGDAEATRARAGVGRETAERFGRPAVSAEEHAALERRFA